MDLLVLVVPPNHLFPFVAPPPLDLAGCYDVLATKSVLAPDYRQFHIVSLVQVGVPWPFANGRSCESLFVPDLVTTSERKKIEDSYLSMLEAVLHM